MDIVEFLRGYHDSCDNDEVVIDPLMFRSSYSAWTDDDEEDY